MKSLKVDLWSAAIEGNLQHYSTQGKIHEPRITPAEERIYPSIYAPAAIRFRHAASIYRLQYSNKLIFSWKKCSQMSSPQTAHSHRWFCSEGGTEFENAIGVKSKVKHGWCFPCYLFIDGLPLPVIMDNFNTDIFGGSQGDVMNYYIWFQPPVSLPLAAGMNMWSWCFYWGLLPIFKQRLIYPNLFLTFVFGKCKTARKALWIGHIAISSESFVQFGYFESALLFFFDSPSLYSYSLYIHVYIFGFVHLRDAKDQLIN